jgi:MOSC domain-containing protein YiiM
VPIVGLYTAAGAGAPMTSQPTIWVDEGLGVVGDRYRERSGHWSDPRWPDQQITLVETETADALGLAPNLLRRNIVTRGDRLSDLLGFDVRIGGAMLRFVRPCDPCTYLETMLERPGLRDALDGRGGVRAAVIQSGAIAIGDALRRCGTSRPPGA